MMNDEPLPVIAPAHVKYLGAKAHWFVCFIHSYPRAKARGNEFSIRANATTVKPLRGFFLFPFNIKNSSFTIHTRGGIGFELPRRGYGIVARQIQ